jgi:hypothetical protein
MLVAVLLALSVFAPAQEEQTPPAPSPTPSPAASPAPGANPSPAASPSPEPTASPPAPRRPGRRRLDLGDYRFRRPGERDPELVLEESEQLRFEAHVDVFGRPPMDAVALTAKMEWWLRDFEPLRGATPGGAPRVEDTSDFRPMPAPAADLMPVFDWVVKQFTKKR